IPSVSDLPSGGACVSPGDTPGEFADLIDSLLNSLGHPNGESAQGDNEEPALQPAPRSTGLSGAPSPVPVDAPSLSRVDGSESENGGKGAQLGAGYQSAPRDRPAASAPPGGTETRQVPVPLVLDLPIVPTREHVPTGPVPETADADGSLTMPAELRLPEALCRSTADGRHDSASEWTDAFGPPADGSLTTETGEIAAAIVTRRTEATSVNKQG